MMRYLPIMLLALALTSCRLAPTHTEQQRLVVSGCGAMVEVVEGDATIWLLDDLEEICTRFEDKTGHPAKALLWQARVRLHYRRGVMDRCGVAPACTYLRRYPHRYDIFITTLPDASTRTLTMHEVAHVLLFQAGYDGSTHHALMRTWGLCAGHCDTQRFAPRQRALP